MKKEKNKKAIYILLCASVAGLGGLLFGYDTAVVNGAIGYLQHHFDLSAQMKGWAASSALIGCIIGAAFGGFVGDLIGRKKSLLISALLFALSAMGSALPETLNQFIWFRFIGGAGVGVASIISPLYISELSPPRFRGRLVSIYQLAIVSGILLVFFINMLISRSGDLAWNIDSGWRWMFGSEAIPAVIFGVLVLFVPESPRWLISKGKVDVAESILLKINEEKVAYEEVRAVREVLSVEKVEIITLFSRKYRWPIFIGIGLAILCQFSGINAIMYYSTEILASSGSTLDSAFFQTVLIGVINLLFTFVAILAVDRLGRKKLLIIGTAFQVIALSLLSLFFAIQANTFLMLLCIFVFVAAFAMALGPLPWIIISEIFPTKVRGAAMSVATFFLWLACYAVTQLFPIFVDKLGNIGTFLIFSFFSLLGLLFAIFVIPETKGKSLEEIELGWKR
ncbi:MAG: sugar porter family MFS transporter [Spirochaetales bacterium]|nr:sugar porter family MFS transporter [Spirochaetales bacterium]